MKIESIKSFEDAKGDLFGQSDWREYQGFTITTDKKTFHLLVSNSQSCCESFGHITSEENLDSFIGAEILEYRCVDNADYNDCELTKKEAGEYVDVYDCAFIDFKTDKGVLQFAVYNSHNGYYGHDIQIVEKSK